MQKMLYDIGFSDEKKCQGCNKEEGTEKHRLYYCPCWKEIRGQIPEEFFKEMGATSKDIRERLEVAESNHDAYFE